MRCIDDGWDEVIVTAAAEKADGIVGRPVRGRQTLHVLRQFHLAERRERVTR